MPRPSRFSMADRSSVAATSGPQRQLAQLQRHALDDAGGGRAADALRRPARRSTSRPSLVGHRLVEHGDAGARVEQDVGGARRRDSPSCRYSAPCTARAAATTWPSRRRADGTASSPYARRDGGTGRRPVRCSPRRSSRSPSGSAAPARSASPAGTPGARPSTCAQVRSPRPLFAAVGRLAASRSSRRWRRRPAGRSRSPSGYAKRSTAHVRPSFASSGRRETSTPSPLQMTAERAIEAAPRSRHPCRAPCPRPGRWRCSSQASSPSIASTPFITFRS